jgi:hypothetical protein
MEEVEPSEKVCELCISLRDVPEALAEAAKVLADATLKSEQNQS